MKHLSYLAAISAAVLLTACETETPMSESNSAVANPPAASPAPAPVTPAAPVVPQAAGASASGESIVDNGDPGFKSVGSWTSVPGDHNYKEEAVWAASTAATETPATATWTPDLKAAGLYDVYEWHGDDPNADHATKAPFTIKFDGDTRTIPVNLRANNGKWNLLGTFKFAAGKAGSVTLSSNADGNVLADAVKFVRHQ